MKTTIVIGGKVYALGKAEDGSTALIEQWEVTDENPAPTDAIDGDALVAEVRGMSATDRREAHEVARAAYNEATAAVQESGSLDDLPAQEHAAITLLVTRDTLIEAEAAMADAVLDEGSLADLAVPENTPPPAPSTDDPPAGADDDGNDDTDGDDGPSDDDDGGDGDGDDAGASVDQVIEVFADLVSANLADRTPQRTTSPTWVRENRPLTRAQMAEGAALGQPDGDGGQAAPVRERAPLVAAAGASVDTAMELDDATLLEVLQDWESGHSGVTEMGSRTVLANYRHFDGGLSLDTDAPNTFAAVRASGQSKSLTEPHRPAIHADGSTCDNCVRDPDVRRAIPDESFPIPDMADLLQVFPSQHCDLKYYKALSLAAIDAGVTNWDATRSAAFCAARDAYYAALRGAGPVDPQLYVDMKQLEKDCAIPSCVETDQVQPEALSVCLKYPLEMAHCSPEIIPIYRNALLRWYQLRKNMRIMQMMDRYAIPIQVDANAAPFVNPAGDQIGGVIAVMEVIQQLLAASQMAEMINAGNYTLVMQFGFDQYLTSDELKRAHGEIRSFQSYIGLPTYVTWAETPVPPIPAGAGLSDPGPAGSLAQQQAAVGGTWEFNGSSTAFATGALPPNVQQGGLTGISADITAHNAGTDAPVWNTSPSLRWPTRWTVRLVDTSDYFMVTRPTVRFGAQSTPDLGDDGTLANMVFDLFLEEFFGVGKDGLSPSWTIHFHNLCNNGARADAIQPPRC